MDLTTIIDLLKDYSAPTIIIIILAYIVIKLVNLLFVKINSTHSSNYSNKNQSIGSAMCYENNTELKLLKEKITQNQNQLEKLEDAVYQLLDKNNEDHNKIAMILQKIAELTESTINLLNKLS